VQSGSRPSDDEIDALLAQGRLAGPAKDRILAGALSDVERSERPRRARRRRLRLVAGLLIAAALAGALAAYLFWR
jgi:hypothetical protein